MLLILADVAVGSAETLVRPDASATSGARPAVMIRCESVKLRFAECGIGDHGAVRLEKVLGGRCVAGLTWFYGRRYIHVRGGCRAIFSVAGAKP